VQVTSQLISAPPAPPTPPGQAPAAIDTSWVSSLVQVGLANDDLALRNGALIQGVANGSVAISQIEIVLQTTDVQQLADSQSSNFTAAILDLACGDPSATNYIQGGQAPASSGACQYAALGANDASDVSGSTHQIVIDIVCSLVGVCSMLALGFMTRFIVTRRATPNMKLLDMKSSKNKVTMVDGVMMPAIPTSSPKKYQIMTKDNGSLGGEI